MIQRFDFRFRNGEVYVTVGMMGVMEGIIQAAKGRRSGGRKQAAPSQLPRWHHHISAHTATFSSRVLHFLEPLSHFQKPMAISVMIVQQQQPSISLVVSLVGHQPTVCPIFPKLFNALTPRLLNLYGLFEIHTFASIHYANLWGIGCPPGHEVVGRQTRDPSEPTLQSLGLIHLSFSHF